MKSRVQIQKLAIGQEIYWVQGAHQNCISFGDRNKIFFEVVAAIRKRKNFIWKSMDEKGIWSEDQNCILQVFLNEFQEI